MTTGRKTSAVAPSFVANHKYAVLVPARGRCGGFQHYFEFCGGRRWTSHGKRIRMISRDGIFVASGRLISASDDLSAMIILDSHGTYRLFLPDSSSTINLSAAFAKGGMNLAQATFLDIDPADNAVVIAADPTQILSFDSSESALSSFFKVPSGKMLLPSITASPSSIAWALFDAKRNSSRMMIYDPSAGIITDDSLTLTGKINTLNWLSNNNLGILTSDQELYSYDQGAKKLQKFADDVLDFSETQDGATLAALESDSLEIFSLDDPTGYERFRLPDNGSATGILWYHDGDHLFVVYPDHVSFLDLQDASLANFTTVAQGTLPKYDPDANALYLINSQGHLLRFDFANKASPIFLLLCLGLAGVWRNI